MDLSPHAAEHSFSSSVQGIQVSILGNLVPLLHLSHAVPCASPSFHARTLLYKTLNAPPRTHRPRPDDILNRTHGDHSVDNAPNGCLLCSAFYSKHVALSTAAAAAPSSETANQRSQPWLFARRL